MRHVRFAGLVMLALAHASCSTRTDRPPLYPVKGQVLYEGKPAAGAVVVFHGTDGAEANASRPRGKADPQGNFALSTYEAGDGAPAGDYVATVEWRRVDVHPAQGGSLLPPAYADPKLSKLKVTVVAGTNDFVVLRLTREP